MDTDGDDFSEDTISTKLELNQNIINVSVDQLATLDKQQLIDKIISMQSHIKQLKGIINRRTQINDQILCQKNKKEFNYSQYKHRHIFLKFLYLGWNYKGYVVQEDCVNTVEDALFEALLKVKLIESRETCNYHRCGRTDKGVSAFSQVVSLTVRSQLKHINADSEVDCRLITEISDTSPDNEMDYVSVLNGVLPNDIRVYAWAPLNSKDISARFDCQRRVYHYYFPRAQFDIDSMNLACKYLIGVHDFRNLCKMDVNNGVVNYIREVYDSGIEIKEQGNDPYSICVFFIEASAFLWHQIRCLMAVLFLVGQGLEKPTIIENLLNVVQYPSKPQYSMAHDLPLVLFSAIYDPNQVPKWFYGKNSAVLRNIIEKLQQKWNESATRSAIIKSMFESLQNVYKKIENKPVQFEPSYMKQSKIHKALLDRPVCQTLEKKIQKCLSNKRIKLQ